MESGKIKWFDKKSGYGFIQPALGSIDVFFHTSAIHGDEKHHLEKGDDVRFKSEQSPRGPEAITMIVHKLVPDT
jgi:cold shock protein